MTEIKNNKTIDLATTITICGIFLYSLGWIYWTIFFKTLNISSSYIDISFDKIIATTWFLVLIIIGGFFLSFQYYFEEKNENLEITSSGYVIICSLLILLGVTTSNYVWYVCFFIFLLIYAILIKAMHFYGKNLGKISKKIFIYIVLFLFYISACIFYINQGEKDANQILTGNKKDIEIKFNNAEIKNISGKFVAYMNNKYFLIVKNKNNKKELYIINDSEVFLTKSLLK